MAVVLDLSSVYPRKALYLFVTQLQAAPKEDTPAVMDKINKIRLNQIKQCYRFICDTVFKNNPASTTGIGVILCGDMGIVAENILPEKSETTQENATRDSEEPEHEPLYPTDYKELAEKINSEDITVDFATVAIKMSRALSTDKLKTIGKLRNRILNPRIRLLFLISMIWKICEDEINSYLKQFCQDVERMEQMYQNTILQYFRLMFGIYSTLQGIYSTNTHNDSEGFWNIVVERLSKYGLSDIEKKRNELRDKVLLYKYQLIKIFEENTGLVLSIDIKEKIITEDLSEISMADIYTFNLSVPLYINYSKNITSGSEILDNIQINMKGRLAKSSEYGSMIRVLQCLDAYRVVHPLLGGFTVMGKYNVLARANVRERTDFIFWWDFLGDKTRIKLQDMQCTSIKVKPFGDTPQNQASAHYALDAYFILKQ